MNINKSYFSQLVGASAIIAAVMALPLLAKATDPYADSYEVNTAPDPRFAQNDYRPGELIVKFKTDGSRPTKLKAVRGKVQTTTSVQSLNTLLDKYGAEESEELMPLTGAKVTPAKKRLRSFNGKEVGDADLSSLYLVRLDPAKAIDLQAVAREFAEQDDVEYAEPNYKVYVCATGASQYKSDPLYSQQWGPAAIKLDKLWDAPVINTKRPIIAILDTGVDIEHPDLADNIWTNSFEQNGSDGRDDDANGFVDDIHGWDFVNKSPRMRDNNGHGTHCAGIAAATGGNGIGITGANPDALIMPITVMQSDGSGDVATIIKGIDYAAANGADVLSMSFGSYSHSLAEYDALAKTYHKAVLVAAAGNDGKDLNWGLNYTMFPAAYNFVLGVMASNANGTQAVFSNCDSDGPLACGPYNNEQLYSYEVMAPGVNILSTYPGGQYKSLNGTSMACPLVAGAVSRLYQCKDIPSKELLFGDLIHTLQGGLTGVLDIETAYKLTDADRKPTLAMTTYRLDDSSGDNDKRADAGETIDLYPTIRNFWGQAKNVKLKLSLGENEDPEIVEFLVPEVTFDSELSSYSLNESKNPLRFKINDNCVDGRHIRLTFTATCDNITEVFHQEFVFSVENGIELGGIISEDMTLYPDKHYIVTSMLAISKNVTLTIMPGTTLKFKDNVGVSTERGDIDPSTNVESPNGGKIIAIGTADKPITFTKTDLGYGPSENFYFGQNSVLKYCRINQIPIPIARYYKSIIYNSYGYLSLYAENCTIFNNQFEHSWAQLSHSNFIRNWNTFYGVPNSGMANLKYNNVNTFGNYFLRSNPRIYFSLYYTDQTLTLYYPKNWYYGSSRNDIIRNWILDMIHPLNGSFFTTYAQIDLNCKSNRPDAEAPGCLWKIVVDGYDAQDEFEKLPDLGVGKHKFEVYFSKQMNHEKTPFVAMGVRPPYTQIAIAEESSWRTEIIEGDSIDVYTVYLTIKGKDTYDGLNRIYVSDAEDLEHFPCPIEDFRFNVNVQSAGAMSSGFMAEAGVGKVKLTWENPEGNFDDMLGYNMYRYILDENNVAGDTIRINEKLLDKEELIDYDIIPGKTYCYYYKVLRTSLEENSPSKVVAATPRAAGKGDANASGDVDVADVVTEVNYMVGRDPKPFIFDAADVNDDKGIDILDVVGTVNIIMKPQSASVSSMAERSAVYTIEDGILYINSSVDLAGVQIELRGERGATEIRTLDALRGMESTGDWLSDTDYRFIAFSLSGKTLENGRQALLAIGSSEVEDVILVDVKGNRVSALRGDNTSGISTVVGQQIRLPYPNPFNEVLNVPVTIATDGNHNVEISLTNLVGTTLCTNRCNLGYGEHTVTLPTANLAEGFYIVTLTVNGKKVQSVKAIKK